MLCLLMIASACTTQASQLFHYTFLTYLQANTLYASALSTADSAGLEKSHFIRLSTVLNFTVFVFDVMNDSRRAVDLAKQYVD